MGERACRRDDLVANEGNLAGERVAALDPQLLLGEVVQKHLTLGYLLRTIYNYVKYT